MDPEEKNLSDKSAPDRDRRLAQSPEYPYLDPWREPAYRTAPEFRDRLYTPGGDGRRDFSHTRPEHRDRSGRPSAGTVALLLLLCVLLSGAVGAAVGYAAVTRGGLAEQITVQRKVELGAALAPAGSGTSAPAREQNALTPGEIYDAACSQVVGIRTALQGRNLFGQVVQSGVTGTGFIISEDGYILTNFHVIEYALDYHVDPTVVLYDGTEYTAEIVGYYDSNDVALLHIAAEGLTPAPLGDSDAMRVGDRVYCVGNPMGELDFSMSRGTVGARDRALTMNDGSTINMLQIDAAVNSGNSGGPVYDADGRVVGIVTAKYGSGGAEGLGFAIPINDAMEVVADLREYGYVTGQAAMGIRVRTVSPAAAQFYRLRVGAMVDSVEPDSCAARAGMTRGDIITRMGDKEITSGETYLAALRSLRAGDTVEVTVFRQERQEETVLTVVLDEYIPADK